MLLLSGDYVCLLQMFGWRLGANEVQLGIVMAHFLNKVQLLHMRSFFLLFFLWSLALIAVVHAMYCIV